MWVPFALGRPLGSAVDPDFQKDVIRATLGMLDTATAPTIQDYEVEIPEEAGPEQWACPLNLGPVEDTSVTARLLSEVARLRPWSEETRRDRGRSLFGASGAQPAQVDDVAALLGAIAESGDASTLPDGFGPDGFGPDGANGSSVEWAFEMPLLIRHLTDDLRTFYHEAIAAQPGPGAPNHDALNDWIFGGTALGETLQLIADHLTELDTPIAKLVRGTTIPEGHYKGGSAF